MKKKIKKTKDLTKGTMRLRGNLKLKYAASVYSMQASSAKLETMQARLKHLAETDEKFAEVLGMLSEEQELKADASKSAAKLQVTAKEVCEKFNIPFTEFRQYVVDTESGQITHTPIKDKDNG